MKTLFSVVSTLLLLVSTAFAQADRGAITGTVSDPAGAVVPNAAVEARAESTDLRYKAATTGTGNFTLGQLPAGTYEISVTASGFKKSVRPGIQVQVGETLRVDIKLEVGATSETITVTEEAPLLKTESGELSHQIDYSKTDDLPVFTLNGTGTGPGNIRDPLSVVNLLPGATQTTDSVLRINGMPSSSQSIMVEGQDATNGTWKQINQAVQQGVDAVQEVSVQTSNFAAEYGQAGGGYFNYTMKSGTNQLHGSAYDYFQNEFLNAATPFTSEPCGSGSAPGCTQHIKNELRRNDYGFTLGGPVIIPRVYSGKDKSFFFFNFEQFRQSTVTSTGIATVPTDAYRQGNFGPTPTNPFGSAFPFIQVNPCAATSAVDPAPIAPAACAADVPSYATGTIFDPTTNMNLSGGVVVRTPFPSQTIPQSRLDPAAAYLQSLFPEPNLPGAVNNYAIPAYSDYRHTTIPSIKIDQAVTSSMKLSGYFSATLTSSPNSNGFSSLLAPVAPQDDTSYTTRINFDQTITPTLLLHIGAGLLYYTHPTIPATSPFTANVNAAPGVDGGFSPFPASQLMPSFSALTNIVNLAGGLTLGTGFFAPTPGTPIFDGALLKDVKPTGNGSVTWVRGNHTYKAGMSLVFEGFPQQSSIRAFGYFGFGPSETGNPYENGLFGVFPTGFTYASFLLGRVDSEESSAINDTRLGNHSIGLFIQDNWKVTRKLTLDYGLRYDYATLLTEQYGRMQSANFLAVSPTVGLPGSINYGATCHCSFNENYPFAIGPRLGVAYQIDKKTVLRFGGGVSYSTSPDNAFLSYSVANFYTTAGNAYGNAVATPLKGGQDTSLQPVTSSYPQYTQYPFPICQPANANGCLLPSSPFISIDKGTGRLPRIFQYSVGVQREIMPNLLIEGSYVGNRGAWWAAPTLDSQNYNGLTLAQLQKDGINTSDPVEMQWLLTPLNVLSGVQAANGRPAPATLFPFINNPNLVYPGFPGGQTLGQALRPYPQWYGVPPFLGPPLGDTWYDSLQVKLTKRYSRGLSVQGAYTRSKSLTNGANANTGFLTPEPPLINDVYKTALNKQISGFDQPEALVVSFSYTTPTIMNFGGSGTTGKTLRYLARDWTFAGVLRYASGLLIETPPSNNGLLNELQIGASNNPALFGGGNTFENYVTGQSCLAVNPNSHFDPTKTLALNPSAWVDVGSGVYGVSAPYYDNCRWQRQPAESLSVGRIFRVREKYQLQIRAEFQNVFNRVFYSMPSVVNSTTAPAFSNNFANGQTGALSSGFGFVNSVNGAGATPRSGQLVARFSF